MTLKEILNNLEKGVPVPYEEIMTELEQYDKVVQKYGGDWVKIFMLLLKKSDPPNLRRLLKCCGNILLDYKKFLKGE